jgi:uncharacterized protein (TIGR01619 family)
MENEYFSFMRGDDGDRSLHLGKLTPVMEGFANRLEIVIMEGNLPGELPNQSRYEQINKVEERLIPVIESADTVYVGRIIKNGGATSYFYSRLTAFPPVTVKTGLFKKQTFAVTMLSDPEWHFYRSTLCPDRIEMHISRNRNLIVVFEQQGDDLSKVRPVDFGCYFNTRQDLENFLAEATSVGYGHSDREHWGSPEDPGEPTEQYLCELVIPTVITEREIAELCVTIEQMAERHNGVFDGWAGPVAR